MMKMIAATNNSHKLEEIRAILKDKGIEVISLADAGLDIEIEENGDSFMGNALIKAREVFLCFACPIRSPAFHWMIPSGRKSCIAPDGIVPSRNRHRHRLFRGVSTDSRAAKTRRPWYSNSRGPLLRFRHRQ